MSVNGLSMIFSELFSILQFPQILTKILKEKIVTLIIKGVGMGGRENLSVYLQS